MDNDDKIKRKNADITVFLEQHIEERIGPPDLYDLQEEFKKNKKNKELLYKLAMALFFIIIFFITYGITKFIEKSNSKIDINISDFTDVDLKEILNTAKKYENELIMAKKGAEDIISEKQIKINEKNAELLKNIESLKLQNLAPAEFDRRVAIMRRDNNNKIFILESEYQKLLLEKEKEISGIEEKIKLYDQKQIETAKKNEEVLNNQQRLFDIERRKVAKYYDGILLEKEKNYKNLKDYYVSLINIINKNKEKDINSLILKYNPIYTDEEFLRLSGINEIDSTTTLNYSIISNNDVTSDLTSDVSSDRLVFVFPYLIDYKDQFAQENVLTESEYNSTREYITGFKSLMRRLNDGPYINSIPKTFYSLYNYYMNIVNRYETFINRYYVLVEEKNRTIQNLNQSIQDLNRIVSKLKYDILQLEEKIVQKEEELAQKDKQLEDSESILYMYQNSLTPLLEDKYSGIIVNIRDNKDLILYIKNKEAFSNGKIADVVSLKNEKIGKIKIVVDESGDIRGEEYFLNKKKQFNLLDRILLIN